ncbi:MAG: hypothetical protein AB1413_00475 [Thermodesulfobacteriota bacterium]
MNRTARRPSPLLAALAFLCCWQLAGPALAREPVSCRYLVASGNRIELEVSIGAPPPATLIITQSLPPDVTVVSTSPPVKKFSQKPGEAKWLVTGSGPGTTVLVMTLDKPVQAGQITGEMMYNDPATGATIRRPITP